MKKIIFFFLLFSSSIYSQKVELDFTLKSNYTFIKFEDGQASYQLQGINGEATTSQYKNYTIHTKGKLGFEFGIKTKLQLVENIFIYSGLEISMINFNKTQRLTTGESVTSLFIPEGETEVSMTMFGVPRQIKRDKEGNALVFNGNTGEAHREDGWNQKLLHFRIPFNMGFSPSSNKWNVYGGLWYGRLFHSKYEGHNYIHDKKSNDFFTKHLLGVNAGFDFKVYKRMSFVFNYSSGSTSIYATENPLDDSHVRLPKKNAFHVISTGVFFKLF